MHVAPYVYFIYNKITNHFYIGSRKRNVDAGRTPEEDLWRYYFTSSKVVEEEINEFGSESFVAEVIYTCKDSDHQDKHFWYEQQIIMENFRNPLCMNRHYFDPSTKERVFRKGYHRALTEEEIGYLERQGWQRLWDEPAIKMNADDVRTQSVILQEITGFDLNKLKTLVICNKIQHLVATRSWTTSKMRKKSK